MDRLIPKLPEPPPLDTQLIEWLTALCFRKQADGHLNSLLLCFGSANHASSQVEFLKKLLPQQGFKHVIFTGGAPDYSDLKPNPTPEATLLREALAGYMSPGTHLYLETESKNTLENVLNCLPWIQKIQPDSLVFNTFCYSSGRCYLTLRKHLKIPLHSACYDPFLIEDKTILTSETWSDTPGGRSRVWGEFLRIVRYGEKNDIEFAEVSALVAQIQSYTTKIES